MAIAQGSDVRQAIVAGALDYYEGWFEGESERMERALHPDLVKRSLAEDGMNVETISAREMVEATAKGIGLDQRSGKARPRYPDPRRSRVRGHRDGDRHERDLRRLPAACAYARGLEDRQCPLGPGRAGALIAVFVPHLDSRRRAGKECAQWPSS